jgi:hypothetical protein
MRFAAVHESVSWHIATICQMRALRPVWSYCGRFVDIPLVPPPSSSQTPPHSRAPAFAQVSRNLALASSSVAAWPFVTLGTAGTMAVTDQNQRNSGGVLR